MTYADWQQRVIEERDQLQERLTKLQAFVVTPAFKSLPWVERSRLISQKAAMTEYLDILGERIEAFQPPT